MEDHTTPECLEMISHLLTKQSGSPLHDSQVHVFDAVGHPVYHHNRNGRILKSTDVGEACIQRTHHWSPLSDEVEFVRTQNDIEAASFDCAKDRHVFPWVDVNARFGFIKYSSGGGGEMKVVVEGGRATAESAAAATTNSSADRSPVASPISIHYHPKHHDGRHRSPAPTTPLKDGWHPMKLVESASKLR
jgi:hypothetical protein